MFKERVEQSQHAKGQSRSAKSLFTTEGVVATGYLVPSTSFPVGLGHPYVNRRHFLERSVVECIA